jgi:hypothetical protein
MLHKELKFFLVALCLLLSSHSDAREIALFDREGTAIAYIDTGEDLTIFLWNGSPVAYLEKTSIYGFNGKHLGWFKDGIVRDHQGNGVGFVEGAVNKVTKLEPLKSLRKLTPIRAVQQLEPLEPMFRDSWSRISLDLFLSQGAK